MRTDRQRSGDEAEGLAAAYLERLGWTILGRQVRVGRGELDLVATDPGPPPELVIVEVRRRSSRAFGLAEESVGFRKRSHLRTAIGRLLQDGLPGGVAVPRRSVRVDLVVVEPRRPLRHHRAIEL